MKNLLKVAPIVGLLVASQLAYSAPVTDTYTTGDTLTAAKMNNIKSAVNDNDLRLNALLTSSGQNVPVDCTADSSALLNTVLSPGNTYILTGMCDGPIEIDEPAGVYRFQGDDIGSKDDGISLPAGHVPDGTPDSGYAVIAYGPVAAKFVNLTISGALYTSIGDIWVNTLWAVGNSSVILTDVNVVGGDNAVYAENGDIIIRNGVTVTGFRAAGLTSALGGSIIAVDPVTVTGLQSEPGDYSYALQAARSGTVEIYEGGSFTAGTDDGSNSGYQRGAIGAWDNSTINIGSQGTVTLTGGITVGRSSTSRIKAGALTGEISVNRNSHVQLINVTHSSGNINVEANSILNIGPGTTLSSGSSDEINVKTLSSLFFNEGSVGNLSTTATIELEHFSVMETLGNTATDLNFRDINCTNSTYIQNNATQVGTVGASC